MWLAAQWPMKLALNWIALAFRPACGFISNVAFDPSLQEYSSGYEATQSFSPTFNAFAHRLARQLVDQYDLHGKEIIEIGCGQGEFLTTLCELGDNRGVGFDPAYVGGRTEPDDRAQTRRWRGWGIPGAGRRPGAGRCPGESRKGMYLA